MLCFPRDTQNKVSTNQTVTSSLPIVLPISEPTTSYLHFHMTQPTLVVINGFPGVGKSTISHALSKEKQFIHLIGDEIRKKMTKGKVLGSKDETERMLMLLDTKVEEALKKGCDVICDVNYNRLVDRERNYTIAEKHGALAVTLLFECSLDLALERNSKRSKETDAYYHDTTEESVRGVHRDREPLASWERVIVVHSEKPVAQNIDHILSVLKSKKFDYEPEQGNHPL